LPAVTKRVVVMQIFDDDNGPWFEVFAEESQMYYYLFSVDGNSELRAIRLRAKGRQGVFDLKRAASSRAEERQICEPFDGSLEQLLSIIDSEVELIRQRAAASSPTRRLPVNDSDAHPQSKIVGGNAPARAECSLSFAPEVVEPEDFDVTLPYAYRWEIFTVGGERAGV
jgi:hypothetical protein